MGWVRGQTGEQKRKEKQRPPGAGVWRTRGRDTSAGSGAGRPRESFIHRWERDPIDR